MTKSLPLLRGNNISLEDALTDDDNILHRLDYPQKKKELWSHLLSHKSDIEELVSFHLRAKHCQIADESDWLSGSYNACIPVYINPPSKERVLVRIPLPFKIGEANNPGNLDEKLRCEVATYIWIHENCPTVPIPSLYGFAFPDGQTPNAIHDLRDGQEQFAALTMMRALLCQFVSRQYRNGPFVLTLTDLHPSNIFVDEDWHVTSLIDLEWACSFPVELQTPPYWLSGRPIDDIEHGERLQTFEKIINDFMDAFEEQEQKLQGSTFQAKIMRACWNRGSFWYFQAAHSPKGLLRVFNEHIQRRFCEEHCTQRVFDRIVSPYWCVGAEEFIQKKVVEEAEYRDRLRKRFGAVD
ncbi:hypothetical protein LV164_006399 [Aspergillus fumigatus]|nr:hypothetical protein KXX39_004726 [Aspergillus fumigatus]KAH1972923.1 hypothetical protein KXW88_001857 [Aspergillus fumigatus]KAH2302144.1 hypothetical protein KXV47_001464 [Aspergillus fumigatus]KAH2976980.1 hypothetical protein KXV25_005533 [Aspergillus fumigatus]KAH3004950.1 hypothetical protein KXW60_005222 [Aspergillus fumigatus]